MRAYLFGVRVGGLKRGRVAGRCFPQPRLMIPNSLSIDNKPDNPAGVASSCVATLHVAVRSYLLHPSPDFGGEDTGFKDSCLFQVPTRYRFTSHFINQAEEIQLYAYSQHQ